DYGDGRLSGGRDPSDDRPYTQPGTGAFSHLSCCHPCRWAHLLSAVEKSQQGLGLLVFHDTDCTRRGTFYPHQLRSKCQIMSPPLPSLLDSVSIVHSEDRV